MPSPMRIPSKIPTGGVAMLNGVRSVGKSSLNGCGTSALSLGHQLHPDPARTTEFAPALLPTQEETITTSSPAQGYGLAEAALHWKAGRFSGRDFAFQPDGTLRCPAGQTLVAQERRREADGSLRVVDAGSHRSCRPCPRPRAVSMAWPCQSEAPSRECEARIHSLLPLPPCSGEPGVGGCIGALACICCAINVSRSRSSRLSLPAQLSSLRLSPGRSAHTIGSRGKIGWFAMPASQRLVA